MNRKSKETRRAFVFLTGLRPPPVAPLSAILHPPSLSKGCQASINPSHQPPDIFERDFDIGFEKYYL